MEDEKKMEKKRKKFAAKLRSSKGIICTENPTKNIALCNVGQATGLQKAEILEIVTKYVPNVSLPKYVAEKGESHSFLVFDNHEDANNFYNSCNGKVKLQQQGPPLYMSYVESVPITEAVYSQDYPKGLILLENFITQQEEKDLIKLFDWVDETDLQNLKNRQVKHYGYEFRYGSNDVDLSSPLDEKIPKECDILWSRLKDSGVCIDGKPDQLTVNKYLPGQGIPSHVDKHSPFGDKILSLSLGGSVVMDWKHHSGKYLPILVPGRGMLIMADEARYDWQHGIQPRTWDPIIQKRSYTDINVKKQQTIVTNDTVNRETRISLTFRWTRQGGCYCAYKTLCDSQSESTGDISGGLACDLEDLHVHQVYEKIAAHFSTTRHKPWPKVVEFMADVPPGSVLVDLGCGNGKNILRRNDLLQLACERSEGLLNECKGHVHSIEGADCVRLDLLHTTLKDACADVVICIAVIHHFSNRLRRLQAISTIARVLRSGGRTLITVWAKDQTKSNYLCKNKMKDVTPNQVRAVAGLNLPVHENRTQFQHNDLLVPWKLRQVTSSTLDKPQNTLLRYYHVFEEDELVSLCKEVESLVVEQSFYEEGNWCVVCRKI